LEGGDLKEIQSWKIDRDLKLAYVNGKAVLGGLFLGFPGFFTGRMRFQKFHDMVQKMHKEGVNDCVSRWRGDIMNI